MLASALGASAGSATMVRSISVAELQAATTSGKPVLLRVNYEGGHGADTTSEKQEATADSLSFLLWQAGTPEFQPHRR